MTIIKMFTDGSCANKTTMRGGWGTLIDYGHDQYMLFGHEEKSTNNRMELKSVIEGLRDIKHASCTIEITSDSKYVVDMINNNWITNWKRNGWKKSDGQEPANIDLLQQLDFLLGLHKIRAIWVKSHNGHLENELCDQLAKSQAFIK